MATIAAREKEGPEMEHGYAAYGSHPYKNITIHIGGITLKQSKEGVTEIYFSKLASPEYWKDSGEIHFKTSDTELTLTSDIALKGEAPKSERTDNGTVFTLNIGSFTLKVNGFTAKLRCNSLMKENILTVKSDNSNKFFSYEECDDKAIIIAMTYDDRRRLKDLREGEFIPFSGVDDVIHEVTKVERNKGWRTTVTIQTYKDGAPVGQAYTVSGDDNSWFVAAIPPRAEL